MITTALLRLVEGRINEKFESFLIPFDKAYPTSGRTFIRLSGSSLSLNLEGDVLKAELQIIATCSTRIRNTTVQKQDEPFCHIANIAESLYYWLLTDINIKGKIGAAIPGNAGIDGRFEVNYLDLRAVPVYADFYDAREVHERLPAGMKIDITMLMPRIWIPIQCGQFPEAFQNMIDDVEIK
jgi:hypothetical protein